MCRKWKFLICVVYLLTAFSTVANGKASAPDPPDGGSSGPYVVLGWAASPAAVSHDVYFGSDFDDVNSATTASSEYLNNIPNTTYVLAWPLELAATYYWRIDERDIAGSVEKGDIWTFTTVNYLVVDDMESYNPAKLIHNFWLDWRWNSTGATVGLGIFPVAPVHSGAQSMIYDYDNSVDWGPGFYSEIEAATAGLGVTSDWTCFGTRALTLWFYGTPGNAAGPAEQMYVALEDGSGSMAVAPYAGPAINVTIPAWQEWNIPLQDFADISDVNLANVRKIYIGFGIRGSTGPPGGTGTVYFDDIRLYPPRCLPWIVKPQADLNDDCIVSFEDLGIMKNEWLTTGIKADLYMDNHVDFKDFAVLAAGWHEQVLWPPQ
jgi:hypothetical protein